MKSQRSNNKETNTWPTERTNGDNAPNDVNQNADCLELINKRFSDRNPTLVFNVQCNFTDRNKLYFFIDVRETSYNWRSLGNSLESSDDSKVKSSTKSSDFSATKIFKKDHPLVITKSNSSTFTANNWKPGKPLTGGYWTV